MAPRKRCPVCRSKQWHKEPSSGLIVCSEGHILQNYRSETTEADEMGIHALKKRTLKSDREKKGRKSKANANLYHGMRGRYLYFQCQQLVLRKQIAALVRLLSLPPEIEVVCRDVWALHLSLLPDPPPAEPYYHAKQQQDEDEPNKSPLNASANGEEEHPQGSHSDSSSDDENDQRLHGPDQSEGKDPVLADLLRQNSESESDNDEEDVDKTANGGHEAMQGRKKHHAVYEGPANNLAVLMIACWTMRIPLLYRDFTRFIESYELPYLDPVRFLPAEMVSHLTKHAIQALSPAHAPNIVVLHSLTSRLARLLAGKYGVRTPEANAAPILWRVTTSMGGTPTLYRLTKKLSQILSLPLALHHSLVPGLKRVKNRDPESHKFDDVPVELSFMAATIVTLKLVYGLDGNPRSPRDLNDPASGFPTQQNYLDMVKSLNEFDSGKGTSAAEMSDGAIDEYLSFCEHALLPSADVDRDGDKLLTSYFALTRADGLKTATTESTISATARIRLNRISADAERLRPGESYTIYHSRDIAGTMSEETEIVIGRGAKWIGVSEEYLSGVVEKYERRLARWWKETGRKPE